MSADADLVTGEREAINQYADWYARQGYQVSVDLRPRQLPELLRTLASDMIARRGGENVVVQIKTSPPASLEAIQRLARALEHRAGWQLQVVYVDLSDPEWQPPPRLPEVKELLARLDRIGGASGDEDQSRIEFLLLCGRLSRPPPAIGSRLLKSLRPAGFRPRLC